MYQFISDLVESVSGNNVSFDFFAEHETLHDISHKNVEMVIEKGGISDNSVKENIYRMIFFQVWTGIIKVPLTSAITTVRIVTLIK